MRHFSLEIRDCDIDRFVLQLSRLELALDQIVDLANNTCAHDCPTLLDRIEAIAALASAGTADLRGRIAAALERVQAVPAASSPRTPSHKIGIT